MAGAYRLLQIVGKRQVVAAMAAQQLGQEFLVNRDLARLQGGEFGLVVVHQDYLMPQVSETRSGNKVRPAHLELSRDSDTVAVCCGGQKAIRRMT